MLRNKPSIPLLTTLVNKPAGIVRGALLAVCLPVPMLLAQGADKSGYTLFNPTPRDEMRALSTDRPDQTESPYTVDAGHFQVELEFVNYTRDNHRGVRSRDLSAAPVNFKLGLLNHVDLQVMVDPYVRSRVTDRTAGTKTKASGFGDVTTRLKINFWGNDGGSTAFGILPFVKLPLSANEVRNGKTEGGVIFPFAAELPAGWELGAQTGVEFLSDGTGGYDTEWASSVALGHDITERLGGYIEFVAVTSSAPGYDWQGQLDLGLTYAISADTQLDLGCNFGVTKSAPDYQPFMGLTQRF